jgi:hypothetical protein
MRRDGPAQAVPAMVSEKSEVIIRQMNDEIIFYVAKPSIKALAFS